VWDAFFDQMMSCVDVALSERNLSTDDLTEPFLMLGMPAAAVS